MLAGCQSDGPAYTGSISGSGTLAASDLNAADAATAVQTWGAAYSRNEKDKKAALNYAAALKGAGQTGQAVAVMRKAVIYHPQDREVAAEYGKALAADGRFKQALATVRQAQRPDNPDWSLLATEGGILDSLGQHEEARAIYQQALVLAPGEPQVLNNLGLSYVLTDELDAAEKVLREAAASPRATLKTRENLALVLRLRGKGEEAAQISGVQSAVGEAGPTQENTWAELADAG
jgi:Flp pilus assembly protein TadD